MKKIIFSLAALSFIAACGGGDKDKKETTETPEVKTEQTETKDTTSVASNNPDFQKGEAIVADQKNLCLSCHKIDEKLVGPAYRDVANKYENTEENINTLADKVVKGGTGVWGEVPMPPNAVISVDDAKAAVKYILMLRNK